ncbi:MAG: DUF1207 domain-containing protein [Planctomycetaceae bacterium]|jgi:hypothetical protein|nr:DUF1207 domain-containing protein [Planctomycetaceae bacterium]
MTSLNNNAYQFDKLAQTIRFFVTIIILIITPIQFNIGEESQNRIELNNINSTTSTTTTNPTTNPTTNANITSTTNNIYADNKTQTEKNSAKSELPSLTSLRLDCESTTSTHPIMPIDSLTFDTVNHPNYTDNIFDTTSLESRAQLRSWNYQFLPAGRIYQSYLAGVNESRLGLAWNNDHNLDNIWDATVGGNAGLFRYGTRETILPEGIQIEVEASSHLRMDYEHERDMDAMDYRFALPITLGNKTWQLRTGYFHVSSHMGDERMIRLTQNGQPHKRINYVRESIILGLAYRMNPSTRLYFEIDYSTWLGELTKPWHFQFGIEYSSPYPIANYSYSPFAAINFQLLEEKNYNGNITIQAGLQWRNKQGQLFRIGVQYFYGISDQYEHLFAARENKFGIGIWFDF